MATKSEKIQALRDAIEAAKRANDDTHLADLFEEAKQYNLCSKTVKPAQAYEVWTDGDWTWLVLKKYQTPAQEAKNKYARWFCLVDGFTLELGDVYVRDVRGIQVHGETAERMKREIATRWRY